MLENELPAFNHIADHARQIPSARSRGETDEHTDSGEVCGQLAIDLNSSAAQHLTNSGTIIASHAQNVKLKDFREGWVSIREV